MQMEVPTTSLRYLPNEYWTGRDRESAWNEVHMREGEGEEIIVIGDLVAEGVILLQLALYLEIETVIVRQWLQHSITLALLERRMLDANYDRSDHDPPV